MVPRLYVPALAPRDRTVALPADEAGHLRRVLRAKAGDAVRLFDGRGHERTGRVASVDRFAVIVDVGDPVTAAPEWGVRVVLAQAVLKGDKIDDVIRDAVMMGVAAVQPLLTARTDVPAAAFAHARRLDRWRRIAVSSAKQCGRAVVPSVEPPCSLRECLEHRQAEPKVMLIEPSALPDTPGPPPMAAPDAAVVLVGPEGGWTSEEVSLAIAAGCRPVSLGPRTIRADAAAMVALSMLQYAWGERPGPGIRDSGFLPATD